MRLSGSCALLAVLLLTGCERVEALMRESAPPHPKQSQPAPSASSSASLMPSASAVPRSLDPVPALPLDVTVHADHYDQSGVREHIDAYDRRRHDLMPYRKQRGFRRFGEAAFYGWSEDKARQYGVPERTDFGAFIRSKGFSLD